MARPTNVARAQTSDFLTVGADTPQDIIDALAKYFSTFAAPKRRDDKSVCVNCEKPIDGLMHALGAAVAIQWGLAHGEGQCTGCGWPYRGMHYIKDTSGDEILSIRNVFLAYHPDEVSTPTQIDEREDHE